MINKLMKYLFGEKEVVREEEPSIQKAAEEEKDPLHNVGEPVISFVKNFDEKNFTVRTETVDHEDWDIPVEEYKIEDHNTGEIFIFFRVFGWNDFKIPSFLTREEKEYIGAELISPYLNKGGARKSRYEEIKNIRERRRLKKLYCEEDNR